MWTAAADGGGELAVEAGAGAVGVHGGEEDFSGAALFGFASPVDSGAMAGGFAAAGGEDLGVCGRVGCGRHAARVDGDDDGLGAEASADLGDELGVGEGGGVDADLVGAGSRRRRRRRRVSGCLRRR